MLLTLNQAKHGDALHGFHFLFTVPCSSCKWLAKNSQLPSGAALHRGQGTGSPLILVNKWYVNKGVIKLVISQSHFKQFQSLKFQCLLRSVCHCSERLLQRVR